MLSLNPLPSISITSEILIFPKIKLYRRFEDFRNKTIAICECDKINAFYSTCINQLSSNKFHYIPPNLISSSFITLTVVPDVIGLEFLQFCLLDPPVRVAAFCYKIIAFPSTRINQVSSICGQIHENLSIRFSLLPSIPLYRLSFKCP